nr:hypothetical protein BCU01_19995 [Vibrio splendidus]
MLVVAPFCSLPSEPYFNRFLFISNMLSNHYDVTLVTSNFRHFDKTHRDSKLYSDKIKIVLLDEPGYENNVSISRVYSHHVFCRNFEAWFEDAAEQFDLVYSAYPLIKTNDIINKYKKIFSYIHILDVQDVWPESISSALPFVDKINEEWLPFSGRANKVYSEVDAIVAVSKTYLSRASRYATTDYLSHVYIGSSINDSVYLAKRKKMLPAEKIKLFYMGTLSHSYDIETIIRSCKVLNNTGYDVEFHVFGDGPHRAVLEGISDSSVIFYGFIKYEDMLRKIESLDIAVNPIHSYAKQSVTNKISDYLSIRKPILSSQRCSEVKDLLSRTVYRDYESSSTDSFISSFKEIILDQGDCPSFPDFNREVSYREISNLIEELLDD